jgi:hypothetical protein
MGGLPALVQMKAETAGGNSTKYLHWSIVCVQHGFLYVRLGLATHGFSGIRDEVVTPSSLSPMTIQLRFLLIPNHSSNLSFIIWL